MSKELGPYKLLRRIASGGMGEVYLAVLKRDGGFSKTVALKTLLPCLSKQALFAQRFEQEAACAAVLNHPNIVQVFDHGQAGDFSYLTMEFVEGPSLDEIILQMESRPFPPQVVTEIAVQLCRALSHAHERTDLQGHPVGIIHGDVSPSNILLSRDGTVKLADFGLSRIAWDNKGDGTISGKLSYMSPEQANGEALAPASDVFSLGLVLFELFSGNRAFHQSGSPSERLERIRTGQRHSLEQASEATLDKGICQVIQKALNTDPELRYHSASDISRELTLATEPCGPEALAEFVAQHTPGDHVSSATIPEPTQIAQAPVGQPDFVQAQIGKHWLAAVLLIIAIGWAAGFGWWFFHKPIGAKPKPPVLTNPVAPDKLRASNHIKKIPFSENEKESDELAHTGQHQAQQIKAKGVATPGLTQSSSHPHHNRHRNTLAKTTAKDPLANQGRQTGCLRIDLPSETVASLDHTPVRTHSIHVKTRTTHLVKLRPSTKNHPEIMIRLEPVTESNSWKMTISSDPWMRILLNRKPSGQTPRTGLIIPEQGGHLELSRQGHTMHFHFSPIADVNK